MNLNNSVVVVTGGAKGIGYAICEMLAQAGAKIAMVDRDEAQLEESASNLSALTEVQGYAVDITDEGLVEDTFQYILEDFKQVNVVINNAGVLQDGLLLKLREGKLIDKMSLQQFNAVMAVNVQGSFLCGREGALAMIASQQSGLIINMSSLARHGNVGQTNYAASKAAVASMTVGWAKELARHQIRAVAIAPGVIDTEMTRRMPEKAMANIQAAIPCQRLGQASEIAQTVKFVIENDYINGRIVEVDGGLTF
jgi:3-oxoacyl-[acyl-carrier protein] reductase